MVRCPFRPDNADSSTPDRATTGQILNTSRCLIGAEQQEIAGRDKEQRQQRSHGKTGHHKHCHGLPSAPPAIAIGAKPRTVVAEVSRIGRKRFCEAATIASRSAKCDLSISI